MITRANNDLTDRQLFFSKKSDKSNWPTSITVQGKSFPIPNGSMMVVMDGPSVYCFDGATNSWIKFAGETVS